MKMHRTLQFLPLAFLMFAAVVSAHHSAAHYSKQATTTRGVVVDYLWRNPHVTLVWEVKGNNGETRRWVGELSSVTTMISDGMTKNSLKVGEEIEVISCPSMTPGSAEAWVRTIKKPDGKIIVDTSRGACTLPR
jgi:hypothetical protein